MEENKDFDKKKIKNIKIFGAVLTAISGACALIQHPITTGISIAAGLGAALANYGADYSSANNEFDTSAVVAVAR